MMSVCWVVSQVAASACEANVTGALTRSPSGAMNEAWNLPEGNSLRVPNRRDIAYLSPREPDSDNAESEAARSENLLTDTTSFQVDVSLRA